jgi:DNA-binding transcriptional LysR family regulator
MNAQTQYRLAAADLETILAVVRGNTLAAAAERLNVDVSTVFRSIQRIEQGVGQRLFDRSRSGYQPLELAQLLAEYAEHMEIELEAARSAAQLKSEDASGTVRITTTDAILQGLVAPALRGLNAAHPMLSFELHASTEVANLTRRDADIAVRAARRRPQHLVGKHLGPIRAALYTGAKGSTKTLDAALENTACWIGPDDGLPAHESVIWRKKYAPKITPTYRVGSTLAVMQLVELGLGVGILPMFLAEGRKGLIRLSEELEECRTDLWLLTHPESRHLRRVSAVFSYLAENVALRS